VLSFSYDKNPELFPQLVYRLSTGLFSQPRPPLVAASAEPKRIWLLAHALLYTQPKSCRLINGIKVWSVRGHNSGEIKPGVSWCKNSTVERARSAGALSCNGATVAMETAQVFFHVSKFSLKISRQMNSDPQLLNNINNRSVSVKLFQNIVGLRFFFLRWVHHIQPQCQMYFSIYLSYIIVTLYRTIQQLTFQQCRISHISDCGQICNQFTKNPLTE